MKKTVTMLAMLLAGTMSALATPFMVDSIYYEITSPTTVEVAKTPPDEPKDDFYKNRDVIVPSKIEYQGKKYTVTVIGEGAFENTLFMKSIQLPETIDSIMRWAFTRCGISDLNIPKSVTYIASFVASGSGIEKITGMEGVKEFGKGAFCHMPWLKSVAILPETLEIIPDNPFYLCTQLTTIMVHPQNPNFTSFWGCLYSKSKRRLISVPCALTQKVTNGKWNIPDQVEIIGERAFIGNATIITLTVPENVKTVEPFAFMNNSITNIDGFLGVEEVCDDGMAFSVAKGLKLGPNFRKMGKEAFLAAKMETLDMSAVTKLDSIPELAISGTEITSLTIPACVKGIAPGALNGNDYLTKVEVDPNNTVYASRDNIIYSKDFKTLFLYPSALPQKEFTVPAGVTSIGDFAFNQAQFLTKVTLNKECESIGTESFSANKRFKEFVYNENLKTIGKSAFEMTGLTQIVIPAKWEMDHRVFSNCDNLKTVKFEEGRKEIPQETFYRCYNLSDLTLPQSLETIGAASLGDCLGLKEIIVPDKVTFIDQWAFSMLNGPQGYTQLTKVVLGKSVKYIGEQCFAGTSFLKEVYSLNPIPPEMHDGFVPITFREATLFVPGEALQAYKNAAPWMSFYNIQSLTDGVEEIGTDHTPNEVKVENGRIVVESDAQVEVYTTSGQLVYSGRGCSLDVPAHGMYIVRVNGNSTKLML